MTTPLYRPEVLDARRNRWLGRVVVRQPWPHWLASALALLAVVVAMVFLSVGQYARKVRVEGRLVASTGLLPLASPRAGVLAALCCEDNRPVARGAVLAQVRARDADGVVRMRTLRAPRAGRIGARLAHAGDTVAAGQALLVLLPPEATVEAELPLEETMLGSVAAGTEVLLRFRAFPHQDYGQYRGHVRQIATVPAPPLPGADPGAPPRYLATIALDAQTVRDAAGTAHALRPGLRVDADIVLEKRRLLDWLLAPLSRLRARDAG